MERKFKDKLISFLIAIIFLTLGLLYQFDIMAEHYIFGWISYILMSILFIVSLLKKVNTKTRIISLISSVLVLICAVSLHFLIINDCYTYRYERIDDGVKITRLIYKISNEYSVGTANDELVIPDKLNGKDVKVIGAKAFAKEVSPYSSVIIPDTVEVIEESAFYNTGISHVTLSNNLKIIENGAFAYCNLEELNLPSSLEIIGDEAFEFASWTSLIHVNIPNNVKSIGKTAFRGANVVCINNKELDGDYKFWVDGCKFYHESIAYKYEEVIYVLHNDKTATIARIGYIKPETKLLNTIIYNNEEYVVTTIDEKAGLYSKFNEIVIPNTVTTIKARAFANNENLTKIYIPSSVIYMKEDIFYDSLNVKIYTEHSEKPDGWNVNWNGNNSKREVIWDVKSNS